MGYPQHSALRIGEFLTRMTSPNSVRLDARLLRRVIAVSARHYNMGELDYLIPKPMPSSQPDLAALESALPAGRPRPPVERWNPPLSGEMDVRITRNGDWHHEGALIQREALVKLFASILRRDEDGQYYLVTPVEKWRIRVDDAPFVAVRLDVTGTGRNQRLNFATNVGDTVAAGPDHPLIVEYPTADGEPAPYIQVRGRLRALLTRAVFWELAKLGEEQLSDDQSRHFGVWSQGQFFSLGLLDDSDG